MPPTTQTHTYICVYCILEVRVMRQIDNLFLVPFQIDRFMYVCAFYPVPNLIRLSVFVLRFLWKMSVFFNVSYLVQNRLLFFLSCIKLMYCVMFVFLYMCFRFVFLYMCFRFVFLYMCFRLVFLYMSFRFELVGLCFRFVLFVLFRINLIPFVLSVSGFFSWFHLNEVFAFIFSTKYILSSTFVQRSY